jgi:fucose permease
MLMVNLVEMTMKMKMMEKIVHYYDEDFYELDYVTTIGSLTMIMIIRKRRKMGTMKLVQHRLHHSRMAMFLQMNSMESLLLLMITQSYYCYIELSVDDAIADVVTPKMSQTHMERWEWQELHQWMMVWSL